jgi:hypothetical protein
MPLFAHTEQAKQAPRGRRDASVCCTWVRSMPIEKGFGSISELETTKEKYFHQSRRLKASYQAHKYVREYV